MKVKIQHVHRNFLYVEITQRERVVWELTFVYAILIARTHKYLEEKLNEIETDQPWLVVGDFNFGLSGEEHRSRRGASSCFVKWVE